MCVCYRDKCTRENEHECVYLSATWWELLDIRLGVQTKFQEGKWSNCPCDLPWNSWQVWQLYTKERRIFPSCYKNTQKKLSYGSTTYVSLTSTCPTGLLRASDCLHRVKSTCLHAHPPEEPEPNLTTLTTLPQVSTRLIHKPVQEVPKWQNSIEPFESQNSLCFKSPNWKYLINISFFTYIYI